jgi:hypothetical protein
MRAIGMPPREDDDTGTNCLDALIEDLQKTQTLAFIEAKPLSSQPSMKTRKTVQFRWCWHAGGMPASVT